MSKQLLTDKEACVILDRKAHLQHIKSHKKKQYHALMMGAYLMKNNINNLQELKKQLDHLESFKSLLANN